MRQLLAAQWLEDGRGIVPMQFSDLVEALVPVGEVRRAIDELLAVKRAGKEAGEGAMIPVLSAFIQEKLARFSPVEKIALDQSWEPLDEFFRGLF